MKIKEISLNLENVETIIIPAKYILNFYASDNKKVISGHKRNFRNNEIYNQISLIISNEIKEFEDHESWMTEHEYKELNEYIFNREDVVSISIIYEDETIETLYTNWTGPNEYENENQYNYINEAGDVLITIGLNGNERNSKKDLLNDSEYIRLMKILN